MVVHPDEVLEEADVELIVSNKHNVNEGVVVLDITHSLVGETEDLADINVIFIYLLLIPVLLTKDSDFEDAVIIIGHCK